MIIFQMKFIQIKITNNNNKSLELNWSEFVLLSCVSAIHYYTISLYELSIYSAIYNAQLNSFWLFFFLSILRKCTVASAVLFFRKMLTDSSNNRKLLLVNILKLIKTMKDFVCDLHSFKQVLWIKQLTRFLYFQMNLVNGLHLYNIF